MAHHGLPSLGPTPITEISINDVLCGRGGSINCHPGNEMFRQLVERKKRIYLTARFKREKRLIASSIVEEIHALDPPGRFLTRIEKPGRRRKKSGEELGWYEVDDDKARDKTSQALRENAPEVRKEMEVERKQYVMAQEQPQHQPYTNDDEDDYDDKANQQDDDGMDVDETATGEEKVSSKRRVSETGWIPQMPDIPISSTWDSLKTRFMPTGEQTHTDAHGHISHNSSSTSARATTSNMERPLHPSNQNAPFPDDGSNINPNKVVHFQDENSCQQQTGNDQRMDQVAKPWEQYAKENRVRMTAKPETSHPSPTTSIHPFNQSQQNSTSAATANLGIGSSGHVFQGEAQQLNQNPFQPDVTQSPTAYNQQAGQVSSFNIGSGHPVELADQQSQQPLHMQNQHLQQQQQQQQQQQPHLMQQQQQQQQQQQTSLEFLSHSTHHEPHHPAQHIFASTQTQQNNNHEQQHGVPQNYQNQQKSQDSQQWGQQFVMNNPNHNEEMTDVDPIPLSQLRRVEGGSLVEGTAESRLDTDASRSAGWDWTTPFLFCGSMTRTDSVDTHDFFDNGFCGGTLDGCSIDSPVAASGLCNVFLDNEPHNKPYEPEAAPAAAPTVDGAPVRRLSSWALSPRSDEQHLPSDRSIASKKSDRSISSNNGEMSYHPVLDLPMVPTPSDSHMNPPHEEPMADFAPSWDGQKSNE